jgi:hypothetical protein
MTAIDRPELRSHQSRLLVAMGIAHQLFCLVRLEAYRERLGLSEEAFYHHLDMLESRHPGEFFIYTGWRHFYPKPNDETTE